MFSPWHEYSLGIGPPGSKTGEAISSLDCSAAGTGVWVGAMDVAVVGEAAGAAAGTVGEEAGAALATSGACAAAVAWLIEGEASPQALSSAAQHTSSSKIER